MCSYESVAVGVKIVFLIPFVMITVCLIRTFLRTCISMLKSLIWMYLFKSCASVPQSHCRLFGHCTTWRSAPVPPPSPRSPDPKGAQRWTCPPLNAKDPKTQTWLCSTRCVALCFEEGYRSPSPSTKVKTSPEAVPELALGAKFEKLEMSDTQLSNHRLQTSSISQRRKMHLAQKRR